MYKQFAQLSLVKPVDIALIKFNSLKSVKVLLLSILLYNFYLK